MSTILAQESRQYLECLLNGDRREASKICKSYHKQAENIRSLYDIVIKPALYEVGQLWEFNKISVATEHMATAITEGILNEFYPDIIPEEYNGKKVVLTCVTNEEHQVGIKMVADIFEIHGWESYFLGIGAPIHELIKFIQEKQPDCIAISLSIYFNYKTLSEMIGEIHLACPKTPIIVGGQAFTKRETLKQFALDKATYIESLQDLETYIQTKTL